MKFFASLCLLLLIFCFNTTAQTPQAVKYQSVLRDGSGALLGNQNVNLRISIIDSITSSTVYQEVLKTTTNSLGLLSVPVGLGTPQVGTFNAIQWDNGQLWLKVAVDIGGGTNFIPMGNSQLMSVPFALLAQDVVNNDDADADPTNEIQSLSISGAQLSLSNGGGTVTLPNGGGTTGPTGPTGPQGQAGTNGTAGVPGATGPAGAQGDPATDDQSLSWNGTNNTLTISGGNAVILPISGGSVGPTGPTGLQGPAGTTGPNGPTGPQGLAGANGAAGTNGLPGATGATGSQGIDGSNGATGPTGPQGLAGNDGATGPTGAQGNPATDDQTLNWNNGSNTLTISGGNAVVLPISGGSVGPTGPTGSQGPQGTAGTQGPTGPQGSMGTNGSNGATGPTGPQGLAGTAGPQGTTGPQGLNGNTGADGATGPQGPTGLQGTAGNNGTTGPTGPQGSPGSNGTDGATGSTGPMGLQGVTGPTGDAGIDAMVNGTANYIPKFITADSLGDSQIFDDGTSVGIGVDTPLAHLHLPKDRNILIGDDYTGSGFKMIYYGEKGAFRSGFLTNAFGGYNYPSFWAYDSVGFYSFAAGQNSYAPGFGSFAFGSFGWALGSGSVAFFGRAGGNGSYTFGGSSKGRGSFTVEGTAEEEGGIAMYGYTGGRYGVSIGGGTTGLGASSSREDYAVAIGWNSDARGEASIALGPSDAYGYNSFSTGFVTEARGWYSSTFGYFTESWPYAGMAIGRFNETNGDTSNWVSTDPIFQIGDGSSNAARSNSVTILKNGYYGFQTSAPIRPMHLYYNNSNGSTSHMYLEQEGGGDAWLNMGLTGSTHYAIGIDNSDGDKLKIGYNSSSAVGVGSATLLTFQTNGDLGLSTGSPLENVHIVGDPTMATMLIAPSETGSGDSSQIFFGEDNEGEFGMKIMYDGSGNDLEIFGKSGNTLYGPHFSMDRNSGATGFGGNLNVAGTLSKGGGTFKIDHPQDPDNKYLQHSFVESPDMMNVYNGNIKTDKKGYATVTLPDYFDVLNKDFRYQLTVIGTFAQAIIKEKISGNTFVIQTNEPNVEVSWQVTGVRKDPWANANRVVPELDKEEAEKGYYLHPELYGKPANKKMMNATDDSSKKD